MSKVVFIRHGESVWNKENKFTGWTDVGLTEKGEKEAQEAGRVMKDAGLSFDVAITSFLKRAQDTLSIVLNEMGLSIPVIKTWKINERHYGALQGLNKQEAVLNEGEEQVHIWRRSFRASPPALSENDSRHPANDSLYKDIPKDVLPSTESLKDTVERALEFWNSDVIPLIKEGKNILIAGHGNTIRGFIMHLDGLSEKEVEELNIPYAAPLIYEFNSDSSIKRKIGYIGSKEDIQKEIEEIKNQTKVPAV